MQRLSAARLRRNREKAQLIKEPGPVSSESFKFLQEFVDNSPVCQRKEGDYLEEHGDVIVLRRKNGDPVLTMPSEDWENPDLKRRTLNHNG